MNNKFHVIFLEEAKRFLENLDNRTREKILFNIRKSQLISDSELFKKLTDEIWEFRTFYNKTHLRLFAFWDKTSEEKTLVLCTHDLIKKTAKTPKNEIEHAENLRKIYFTKN